MITNDRALWLAAIHLTGAGPRTFLRWLDAFGNNIQQLFSATETEWIEAGLENKSYALLKTVDWNIIERALRWAEQPTHHLIAYHDPHYPAQLKQIHTPPLLLFVRGSATVLSQLQIAMVGSRSATQQGIKNAEQFAGCLAQLGFVVTSGLARGIDAASHRGTLAVKGKTIAVCGTGLHHIYPVSHQKLAEDIVAHEGAIVSEFPLDAKAETFNFPRRNRLIAGLSAGVLVVEAAIKSGSLITAHHALEQGREVFAIPGNIHHPVGRGCNHLIRQGARLVETAQDILDEFPLLKDQLKPPASPVAQSNEQITLADCDPACQQLMEKIDYEITPPDVIVWRTGLTASEVSSMLLVLELKGYVESVPGGYIRVRVT